MHQTNESPASGELDWAKENDCLTKQSDNKSITSGWIVKHPSTPSLGGLRWRKVRGLLTWRDYRRLTQHGATQHTIRVTAKSVTRPRQDRNYRRTRRAISERVSLCSINGGCVWVPFGESVSCRPILAGLHHPPPYRQEWAAVSNELQEIAR